MEVAVGLVVADLDIIYGAGVDDLVTGRALAVINTVHIQFHLIDVVFSCRQDGDDMVPSVVGNGGIPHDGSAIHLYPQLSVVGTESPFFPGGVFPPVHDCCRGLGGLDPGCHGSLIGSRDSLVARGQDMVIRSIELEGIAELARHEGRAIYQGARITATSGVCHGGSGGLVEFVPKDEVRCFYRAVRMKA